MDKSNAALDKMVEGCDMFHDAGSQGDDARDPCEKCPEEKLSQVSGGPQGEDVHQKQQVLPTTVDESSGPNVAETQIPRRHGPGLMALIGYFILRVTFILAALGILFFGGLYTLKFCGIYDPCEQLYMKHSDCSSTPYMNGLLYYVECSEESHCILPGFVSTSTTKDWKMKDHLTSVPPGFTPPQEIEAQTS